MTYLAALGLVAVLPGLESALKDRPAWVRAPAAAAAMTAVVTAMLWPVFAAVFGRGALVGAAANILLVPASGGMMASAFAVWAASTAAPAALPLLSRFCEAQARLFAAACFWAASLPGAAWDLSPWAGWAVVSYYLGVFGALSWPRPRLAAGLAGASLAVWGGGVLAERAAAAPVDVLYLSLPRGSAALVAFSGRRHWLLERGVPAGPLLAALKARGVGRLERLVWGGPERQGERMLGSLAAAVSLGEVDRAPGRLPPLRFGSVVFGFDPPLVRRGLDEFDIIPVRLKRQAVEASTDGSILRIRNAVPSARD
jgi:hypothetical protein